MHLTVFLIERVIIRMKYLLEKFVDGVATNHGYAEVFVNPTARELRGISPDNVGILADDDRAFFWDRSVALHAMVISNLGLHGTLPLLAHFEPDWSGFDSIVSDTVKGSKFDHSPHIRDFLEMHPYLGNFDIGSISYYNENVIGDWADLSDNGDDDSFGDDEEDFGWNDGSYGDDEDYAGVGAGAGAKNFLGMF